MRRPRFGLLLILIFASRAFSEPAQVIIIRHGEKPDPEGAELSLKGRERAAALVPYFLGDSDVLEFGPPVAIYAQAQNEKKKESSVRSIQTVTPLAEALHLEVNHSIKRDDYQD